MTRLRFKPHIDDRYDKFAFMLAFFGGIAGILVARTLGADASLSWFDFLAVMVAVLVIAGYTAYILLSTDRSSISLDRAGDNAYYLGLLFTLVSLGYSLWKVSDLAIGTVDTSENIRASDRVLSLLPDFGLALSSTIAGIVARVIVQQFRSDPVDIETQARKDLGLAVQQLRSSLLGAVSEINSASKAAEVAIQEMAERTGKTLEESAKANAELLSRLGQKIDEFVNSFSDQVRPVSANMKGLADELVSVINHIKEQAVQLDVGTSSVAQDFKDLSIELGKMRQQMEATRGGYKIFFDELSGLADKLPGLLPEDFINQFHSTKREALKRQERFVDQIDVLEKSITRFGKELNGVGGRILGAINSLQEKIRQTDDFLNQVPKSTKPKKRIFRWFVNRKNRLKNPQEIKK